MSQRLQMVRVSWLLHVLAFIKYVDGGTEKLFAVQLEQAEKELIVGASYKIGQTAAIEEAEEGMQMIGWLFIIPLLLLLLIEWEVQRRRGYPN